MKMTLLFDEARQTWRLFKHCSGWMCFNYAKEVVEYASNGLGCDQVEELFWSGGGKADT